ncbi:MAG: 4-amino-4-deoxy-L-arabinose transferase and related glycosyltransferases of PMT family [Microgenomates group bacterium GW2011_GWF2_45_18]|nr:MAG: 4-amino-4-deoxy-L-arabinose transferase and related glycosyltransferases of PMT family [Microgenomates group bacterium GW2011_GWF1_44_10]KKU02335.1 MAG: 4-amino-4-deoxy-L-arabinose transferase and related glycosyltransferases of PMT family [Microgenomates group bacterium GW2011_GWF2_45_18]
MRKLELFVVLSVMFLAFALRMYRISNPVADWHSFRQADTASVTREFVRRGVDLLHPQYHDLSNIQSGKENPEGYRMVEFPIMNAGTAVFISAFNLDGQEVLVGRLFAVIFSGLAGLALYLFVKTLLGRRVALFSLILFSILPYSVYYGRVILPEPFMICLVLWSGVAYLRAITSRSYLTFALYSLLLAMAILVKPFVLIYVPIFITAGFLLTKNLKHSLVGAISSLFAVVPFLFWRDWILQFPEGIPASDWLWNEKNIRFSGAFVHWVFQERISRLILGIGGVSFLILGMIRKQKAFLVFVVSLSAILVYVLAIAGGNVRHDYYQFLILPILCMIAGQGMAWMWNGIAGSLVLFSRIVLIGLLGFSIFVSWYEVRGYFNVNHWEIVIAGEVVDKVIPQTAKIIAPFNGDTAFLFHTKRSGWPLGFEIDKKISQGATHYVTVSYDDEARELEKRFKTIEKTDRFLLLDLREHL